MAKNMHSVCLTASTGIAQQSGHFNIRTYLFKIYIITRTLIRIYMHVQILMIF